MKEHIDTVIIGGGQAGLAVSYCLTQQSRPHVILEQAARAGSAWREGRWDSFTAVTPNWGLRLPGAEYQGDDPDGFLPRDEIVAYLEQYIARFALPIRYGVRVTSVEQTGGGYRIEADETTYTAVNVVIATGLFQQPQGSVLRRRPAPRVDAVAFQSVPQPGGVAARRRCRPAAR